MNTRTYQTDLELLQSQCRDILMSNEDSKYFFRVTAVSLVLAGCPASKVGDFLGVSKAAVTGWVKTADEKGVESLRSRSHPGRPPRLSEDQMNELRTVLTQEVPEGEKTSGSRKSWDGPSLSEFIFDTYGVKMGIRQCQRMLHGFEQMDRE